MRRALLVPLLAVIAVAGCDTGDDGDDITAAFFVGNWTLVGVRDNTGDRTAEVNQALDNLSIDFDASGDFAMAVDYSAAVNGAGTPDTTFTGGYAMSGSGALVLTPGGNVGIAFGVDTEGDSRAELSTAAAIVNQLLNGSALDLVLVGTAVLVIERD